jgi:DNA adenine methylase
MNIEDYLLGKFPKITKKEEDELLKEHKNTGTLAENYVENVLKNSEIKYVKNKRISTTGVYKYIIPDFYLQDLDIILEVKSRGFNCVGTASEKIDHIPRKYSNLINTVKYFDTKVIVVFCGYETINKTTQELVNPQREYCKDFIEHCKKYNVIHWINVGNLVEILPIQVKPFVKWVGGKKKLSKQILEKFPKIYNNYYEPFVGGGYIGLSVDISKKKYFSDINSKLIITYNSIKNEPQNLLEELNLGDYKNNKENFLIVREKFNRGSYSEIQMSAMFIYLNKCCFNGMYRENSSGGFNVPFGDMKNPVICDTKNIKNLSKYLQNVEIDCKSYNKIKPQRNDLVYFDPPYHNTFSDYNKGGFNEESHKELKIFIDELTKQGVNVILSNSNTKFIQELYLGYNFTILENQYSVGINREKIEEVLITNVLQI